MREDSKNFNDLTSLKAQLSIALENNNLEEATEILDKIDTIFLNYIKYIVVFIALSNLPLLTHMLPMFDDY